MCASRKKKGGGCEVEIIMFAKGSPRLILNLFEFSCKNELNVNIKKRNNIFCTLLVLGPLTIGTACADPE